MMESIRDSQYTFTGDMESNPMYNKCNYVDLTKVKGILKKENVNIEKQTTDAINLLIMIGAIIMCAPIIFCDMYFGYTDESCVTVYPSNLKINLKIYLITSAYFNLLLLSLGILNNYYLPGKNVTFVGQYIIKLCTLSAVLINLISFTNTVIGAVMFWGTLYGDKICSSNVSTYIFITLIIKLIVNLRYAYLPFTCLEVTPDSI
jgi:hypothetical protein